MAAKSSPSRANDESSTVESCKLKGRKRKCWQRNEVGKSEKGGFERDRSLHKPVTGGVTGQIKWGTGESSSKLGKVRE
jgi:hypothetical protein